MTAKRWMAVGTAIALAVALVGGTAYVVSQTFFGPKTITAYFTSATGVYPGDEVRVSGVKVGTIDAIQPVGTQAKVVLKVDRDVPVPADAKAVIVAQNLVSARYVQLAPAYRTSGPTMSDGAQIPVDRTAVPVEWDEVKEQLMRLATELGPAGSSDNGVSSTSAGRFIDSAANALDGNGEKLRQTMTQLAGVGRILADGSTNVVDIINNLQTFVTTLRDSTQQIVSFQNRLATITSVLNDSRSDIDAALSDLSVAVGEVQRFIAGSRDQTSEQIQRLGSVTQNLVDHRIDLENVLHAAPNAIANGYNIYNPDTGTAVGSIVLNNFSNPVQFFCSMIGAVENVTATESGKLCAQYLGPALALLSFNYSPAPINPYLRKSASPANLIYTDPALAPGGAGASPSPPETPPAVSAFTGDGDAPPPPGYGLGPAWGPGQLTDHLPAAPSPAVYPGAPGPDAAASVRDLLLPESSPPPGRGGPLPAEAGPPQTNGATP
ncbi:MCE family protein [Mycobacterium sp. AZCC_0083]|uniref:MCE family protein n=1 Tax=Mycobacterium sp. AZCC_0083 TaxID=2735882 RepID=UPI00161D63CD|nr:MCE family protein [Mycobacterium sp. AZCC_0083]MBB5166421.1 virulence factor Mce-like protein [Mycobacterium sp. AZCC_0083]